MRPSYFLLPALFLTQALSLKADGLKINLENDLYTSSTELIFTPTSTTGFEKGLDREYKKLPGNRVNYIYSVAEAKHKLYVNYIQKPAAYTAIHLQIVVQQEGASFFYLEDRTNDISNLSFSLTNDETGKTTTINAGEKTELNFASADVNKKKNFTLHVYPLVKIRTSQVSCATSKNGNIAIEFNTTNEWKAVLRNAASVIIQAQVNTKEKVRFEDLGVGVYFVEIWVNDKLIRQETTAISKPAALQSKFTLSTDTISPGKRFSTNNLSFGGNTWYWEFGDGSTTHGYDVSHTYTQPGNYTVTLTTANITGCISTTTQHIYVEGNEPKFATSTNELITH
jgi:PKD repeat protein